MFLQGTSLQTVLGLEGHPRICAEVVTSWCWGHFLCYPEKDLKKIIIIKKITFGDWAAL